MISARVLFSKSAIATQILLECDHSAILIDVGDGTLRDLTSQNFDFATLRGILITHEHADHTGGFFSLIHFMKHLPRLDPLYIYTPRPVLYLNKIIEVPLMYSKAPFPIEIEEVDEGMSIVQGPFKIEPFRTAHVDFDSIGYSIQDASGYRVVISGDTTPTPKLREKVAGADLAIIESTFEDEYIEYAERYGHMTVSQAQEIGGLAKEMILIHQMPMEYFLKMTCAEMHPIVSSQKE